MEKTGLKLRISKNIELIFVDLNGKIKSGEI